jgi:hypothetical protein
MSSTKLKLIFVGLLSVLMSIPYLYQVLPFETSELPEDDRVAEQPFFQDLGPTDDGSTKIKFTNSVPSAMVLTLKQKKNQIVKLDSCPQCRSYNHVDEIPENICDFGSTQTITVLPGKHQIRAVWRNDMEAPIEATWNLKPGKRYGVCLVHDLSGRSVDWNVK